MNVVAAAIALSLFTPNADPPPPPTSPAPALAKALEWLPVGAQHVEGGAADVSAKLGEVATPRLCVEHLGALVEPKLTYFEVALGIAVAADGSVSALHLAAPPSSSAAYAPLAACLEQALSSARFAPGAARNVIVSLHAAPPSAGPDNGGVRASLASGVVILGSLDRRAVADVVKGHAEQLRACYPGTVSAFGRVKMKWVVNGDGTVKKVEVVEAPPDFDVVTTCLTKEIASWTFPAPKGGAIAIVTHPFVFRR